MSGEISLKRIRTIITSPTYLKRTIFDFQQFIVSVPQGESSTIVNTLDFNIRYRRKIQIFDTKKRMCVKSFPILPGDEYSIFGKWNREIFFYRDSTDTGDLVFYNVFKESEDRRIPLPNALKGIIFQFIMKNKEVLCLIGKDGGSGLYISHYSYKDKFCIKRVFMDEFFSKIILPSSLTPSNSDSKDPMIEDNLQFFNSKKYENEIYVTGGTVNSYSGLFQDEIQNQNQGGKLFVMRYNINTELTTLGPEKIEIKEEEKKGNRKILGVFMKREGKGREFLVISETYYGNVHYDPKNKSLKLDNILFFDISSSRFVKKTLFVNNILYDSRFQSSIDQLTMNCDRIRGNKKKPKMDSGVIEGIIPRRLEVTEGVFTPGDDFFIFGMKHEEEKCFHSYIGILDLKKMEIVRIGFQRLTPFCGISYSCKKEKDSFEFVFASTRKMQKYRVSGIQFSNLNQERISNQDITERLRFIFSFLLDDDHNDSKKEQDSSKYVRNFTKKKEKKIIVNIFVIKLYDCKIRVLKTIC